VANAISRIALSKKKRNIFLKILSQTGQVTEAARAVGYTSTQHLHKMRREDEDFAEEWDIALRAAEDVLADEAIRRGHEGVLEPVYYKGYVVGYRPTYSDSLLMFVLRKLNPAYRDQGRGGDTNINFGVAILPMTAQNEGAWEQRAIEMHQGQAIIDVEAKPVENAMIRTQRSD
jgi:hypothetical protein